jgi:hypothetical protein
VDEGLVAFGVEYACESAAVLELVVERVFVVERRQLVVENDQVEEAHESAEVALDRLPSVRTPFLAL